MNENIMDILNGFDSYATPEEIADTNAGDAPATSIPCSGYVASILSAQLTC